MYFAREVSMFRGNLPHFLQRKGQFQTSYKTILVIIKLKSNFPTSDINDGVVLLHSFDPVRSREQSRAVNCFYFYRLYLYIQTAGIAYSLYRLATGWTVRGANPFYNVY
jgi:hypothetical protein